VSGLVDELLPAGAPSRYRVLVLLAGFVLLSLGLGAVGGVVWEALVDLPTYVVSSDGGASTTERGLTEFLAGDAWFCVIGLVLFLGLGTLAWRWFAGIGWAIVPVVVLTAVAAALLCWMVGYELGPGEFAPRLANARPNDIVPIELTLRARASLLTWPFFAVIPVLLGSSLGRDDEEPRPFAWPGGRKNGSAARQPENG
jgi:hypothetical protein